MRYVFVVVMLLFALPTIGQDMPSGTSHKIMPFTSAQLDEMRQKHIASCNAASFGAPSFADSCTQIYLSMISRWQEKYSDPKVTDKVWNDCYESSGAKYSKDVTGWVECIIRTQYR